MLRIRVPRIAVITGGGGTTYNETISETLTLSDSLANTVTFNNSLTETTSTSDNLGNNATFPNSITENINSSDNLTTSVIFPTALTESLTLSDSVSNNVVFDNSISENSSVNDSLVNNAVYINNFSESITAGFTVSATGGGGGTVSIDYDLLAQAIWATDLTPYTGEQAGSIMKQIRDYIQITSTNTQA